MALFVARDAVSFLPCRLTGSLTGRRPQHVLPSQRGADRRMIADRPDLRRDALPASLPLDVNIRHPSPGRGTLDLDPAGDHGGLAEEARPDLIHLDRVRREACRCGGRSCRFPW